MASFELGQSTSISFDISFHIPDKKIKNSVGLQTGKSMVSTMLTYHCRHENCHRFAVNPRFSSTKTLLIHLVIYPVISSRIKVLPSGKLT